MNLAQLQSALFSLVTRDGSTAVQPEQLVNGGPIAPPDRVGIYAEMYVLRTRDSISEDFPKVTLRLGDLFEQTVLDYVNQRHSTHYSLSMLGSDFAQFLRVRGDRALADLATLEWLHAETFLAADSEVLEPSALATIDPEKFGGATIEFTPSFRLVWLDHDVREAWRDDAVEPEAARTAFLVWRKDFEVFHVAIEDDEAKAIEALQAGGTIETACEAFSGREDPAIAAFTAIGSWVSEGMVARVVV